jgi:hypothetical protein
MAVRACRARFHHHRYSERTRFRTVSSSSSVSSSRFTACPSYKPGRRAPAATRNGFVAATGARNVTADLKNSRHHLPRPSAGSPQSPPVMEKAPAGYHNLRAENRQARPGLASLWRGASYRSDRHARSAPVVVGSSVSLCWRLAKNATGVCLIDPPGHVSCFSKVGARYE